MDASIAEAFLHGKSAEYLSNCPRAMDGNRTFPEL